MKTKKLLVIVFSVLSIFKFNLTFSTERSNWIEASLQEIDARIGSLEKDIQDIQKEIGLKSYKTSTPQVQNNKENVIINISDVDPDKTNISTTNSSLNANIITENGEV